MSICSKELGPDLGTQQGTLATGSAGTTRRQVRERDHVSVSVVTGCHLLASPPSHAGAHVGAKVCRAISDARAARSHDTGASASGHSKEAGGRAPASCNSVTGYAAPSCASPASRSRRLRSCCARRMFSSVCSVIGTPMRKGLRLARCPFAVWSRRQVPVLPLLELHGRQRVWKPSGKPLLTSQRYI